jgi:hypothetical protein
VIATTLIASPAWVPWIDSLNTLLTTLTLLVGLALGVGRCVAFLRKKTKTSNHVDK